MAEQLSMKLLVDTNTKRVLFAEAGKEVVDFLVNLLVIPLGTVVKLLKEGTAGCIGNLYKSVECLDETYLQNSQSKASLLNPTVSSPSLAKDTLFLTGSTNAYTRNVYYTCSDNYRGCSRSYVSNGDKTACPGCGYRMTKQMTYVDPTTGQVGSAAAAAVGSGLVKGVVTYTVMDDLSVMPMSIISGIVLLNKFRVKDVGLLEERTVNLGMKEGLEIMRASLQSKTVLTDVFLGKKAESAGK